MILRDVFEKISLYIKKFAEIIDIVVQYDPVHAALPWAGVRLLLTVSKSSLHSSDSVYLYFPFRRCTSVEWTFSCMFENVDL